MILYRLFNKITNGYFDYYPDFSCVNKFVIYW
jgi:hypothetical protein